MGRTTPRNPNCPYVSCEWDCSRCTFTAANGGQRPGIIGWMTKGHMTPIQPAPAPLPGVLGLDQAIDDAVRFLSDKYPELAPYVGEFTAHISDLTRRLAEAELEACEALADAHAEQEVSRHWKQEAEQIRSERDALREALIQIDHHASQNRVWAGVDGWKYAGLSNVAQKKIHGITQAALATEVKP